MKRTIKVITEDEYLEDLIDHAIKYLEGLKESITPIDNYLKNSPDEACIIIELINPNEESKAIF